jgi:hypothetical protein
MTRSVLDDVPGCGPTPRSPLPAGLARQEVISARRLVRPRTLRHHRGPIPTLPGMMVVVRPPDTGECYLTTTVMNSITESGI